MDQLCIHYVREMQKLNRGFFIFPAPRIWGILVSMKSLLMALLLTSPSAFACPNLQGTYVNSGGEFDQELQFHQESCESAVTILTEGEYSAKVPRYFDGKPRPTFESESVLFEESEVWSGDSMLTTENFFWQSSGTKMQTLGSYRLNEKGDLVVEKVTTQAGEEIGRYAFYYARKK